MRKRTISTLADTLFWYILYALPVLAYLVTLIHFPAVPIATYFTDNLGFVFSDTNPIFTALSQLFGSDGLLPFFANDSFITIVTWFCTVFVVHLAVDVVLFIPRFCHKLINKATQGD